MRLKLIWNETPLSVAFESGNIEIIKLLLGYEKTNVNYLHKIKT